MPKRPPPEDVGIDVINAPEDLFGDVYHVLLRSPWWVTLASIAGLVLLVNLGFALVYLMTGGIANARAGSFRDAFFFSVQTVGTIGYGFMYPQTMAAHLAVTAESIVAIVVAALATGLVFAKFSIPRARLEFARDACVFKYEGQPTLAIRLANTRGNFIIEAQVSVTLSRAEVTREGASFYRLYDLKLLRNRSPALGRSWQVFHPITEDSPLHGASNESLRKQEAEIIVSVMGVDGTSSQTVHGRHTYDGEKAVKFGHRFADMLRSKPDGRVELNYAKLHDITPAGL